MKTEKEILDALRTIRSVCVENDGTCQKCPLRNGVLSCGVLCNSNDDPYYKIQEWELKEETNPRLILS